MTRLEDLNPSVTEVTATSADRSTEPSPITDYHAKYYAHALTRRSSSDNLEKLGQTLLNATVDLNPHQIDAAMFAFRSPLSRGALLADEVGLGKTIEAALIMSQLWAERKRKILVIVPTTLRKQWAQELAEKFFLPSEIFDRRSYTARQKGGSPNPLDPANGVAICSYHFARAQQEAIRAVEWNLVVVDEAHRLRNVFKPSNRIAAAIKTAIQGRPKILLTATPLQNSLLELWGLISFLDEHLFGDLRLVPLAVRRRASLRGGVPGPPTSASTPLPADSPASGSGIRPVHEPYPHHAGLHADRRRAAALRFRKRLPAAPRTTGPALRPTDAHDPRPAQAPRFIELRDRRDAQITYGSIDHTADCTCSRHSAS